MKFEGEEIDGYTIRVKGFKGPITQPLMRGEKLELNCSVEVVEVAVRENLRTGEVFRDHIVRIVEVDSE